MEEQVILAKSGDKNAFDELIRSYVPYMYKIALGILKNEENANDAIGETILKVYSNLKKLKYNEFFKTWMTRILINECNNMFKKMNKITYLNEIEEIKVEDKYDEETEVKKEIENLKTELKIVLILFYYQDMSLREISEALRNTRRDSKVKITYSKEYFVSEIIK